MTYNNSVLVGNWSEERLKNEYEFKLFLRKRERRDLLLQKSRTLFSNLLREYEFKLFLRKRERRDLLLQKSRTLFSNLLREYEFKLFLRKRERRDLLLQKSRTLFSNLLRERPLKLSGTYIQYGFNAQVVASDMPAKPKMAGARQTYGLAMSILVRERQVDYMQNICDGCLMTLSPILTPCCRNTFVIVSARDDIDGEELKYGDEFLLKAENYGDPEAKPLYVRYTSAGVPEPANRMPLRLSSVKDTNCRFTTMPLLPSDRLEGLGCPVKSGAKLIVKNLVADRSLCVMNQNWMQTFFGPECGMTCHNYINIHGRFTAENIFTLTSDVATKSKN